MIDYSWMRAPEQKPTVSEEASKAWRRAYLLSTAEGDERSAEYWATQGDEYMARRCRDEAEALRKEAAEI